MLALGTPPFSHRRALAVGRVEGDELVFAALRAGDTTLAPMPLGRYWPSPLARQALENNQSAFFEWNYWDRLAAVATERATVCLA